jgi:hypothetical protein
MLRFENFAYIRLFCNLCRAFNIFQVYQYFTINRWYFLLIFEHFHEYLMQHSLKSVGTKDHFRWVKVPGTIPYWKAYVLLANFIWYRCKETGIDGVK